MATRAREHMEEIEEEYENEEELEQLLICLDMLRGSSALLRQHKPGLAGLLPSRGWKARRALERLVADLTDVLSATGSTTAGGSQQQQQEEAGGVMAWAEVAGRGGGVKRARGPHQARSGQQHHEQQQGQQGPPESSESSLSCVVADPLGLAEVVEHVMSFAEGREVLGRLSRVCRLWRRVSEGERLCVRVLQRHMPSALLRGRKEQSLHARLGGSARRCLQVHNASLTSRRLLAATRESNDGDVALLTEVYSGRRLLYAACGTPNGLTTYDRDDMVLYVGDGEVHEPFSAASLGIDNIHNLFEEGLLNVRVLVMDKASGVVASLWQGPFIYQGPAQELQDGFYLNYDSKPVPITSMSYNGPPLLAQLEVWIELCEPLAGEEEEAAVLLDRERRWRMYGSPGFRLMGQSSIYGERFIRTRLAEEAMAAKQQGR